MSAQAMVINGSEMVLFGNNAVAAEAAANLHKRTELKSGAVTLSYMSMKEFGILKGLKGQALKRAHARYRNDRGVQANSNLAALIAKGQVLLEKVTVSKDKSSFTGKFITPGELDIVDPKAEARKLSPAELIEVARESTDDGVLLAMLNKVESPTQEPATAA